MNLKTVGVILLVSFVVALYMQFTGMGGRTVPHIGALDWIGFVAFLVLILVVVIAIRRRS